MVVLLPLSEEERVQACISCPHIGLASPIVERSSFLARDLSRGWFRRTCRSCNSRKTNTLRRRRRAKETPEEYAARRAKQTRYAIESKERNPDAYAAQHREAQRRYREKRKEDLRIDSWRAKELRGTKLPSYEDVRKQVSKGGKRRKVGPWRNFLDALVLLKEAEVALRKNAEPESNRASEVVERAVADSLGMSVRRLYEWRRKDPDETLDDAIVDRYLTHYSGDAYAGITVDEVYEWFEDLEAVTLPKPKPSARPLPKTCRSGSGCRLPPAPGKRFCVGHAEQLALVKGQMDDQTKTFQQRIKRKGARPTCNRPGCDEPRIGGEAFCDECQANGWVESDE